MRCKACNKKLGPRSIKYNAMIKDFEVCGECLHIVREIMESHRVQDRLKEMGIEPISDAEWEEYNVVEGPAW